MFKEKYNLHSTSNQLNADKDRYRARILMVGTNQSWARKFDDLQDRYELHVIEEEDLWNNKDLASKDLEAIASLNFIEYQQSDSAVQQICTVAREIDADAIVPGLEYAVLPAAQACEELSLPGLGATAASALTNKLKLRAKCFECGMLGPRFRSVSSVNEVREFFTSPIVIKPANRQASTGVVRVESADEIPRAWQVMTTSNEGVQVANRPMRWVYMAEDLMVGPEMSCEVVVAGGRVAFVNFTQKMTAQGSYPVEIGHYVPAALGSQVERSLLDAVDELISCLEVGYGILHAEWILTEEGPKLVECAGRPPGDLIFTLIEQAYGFCPYTVTLDLLTGSHPDTLTDQATQGTAIRFLEAAPGMVCSVPDLHTVTEHEDVVGAALYTSIGAEVGELRNSWNRVGHVLTKGADGLEAWATAQSCLAHLEVETEPRKAL